MPTVATRLCGAVGLDLKRRNSMFRSALIRTCLKASSPPDQVGSRGLMMCSEKQHDFRSIYRAAVHVCVWQKNAMQPCTFSVPSGFFATTER